jgi:hypothetical protein
VEVNPETGAIPFKVWDEIGRVALLLAQPAIPKIFDTLLVARRADDPKGMKVNSALDDVGGIAFLSIDKDGVPLEQDMNKEMILVILRLNNSLRYDLTCRRSKLMEVSIPQLKCRLAFEPSQTHEKTEWDTVTQVVSSRLDSSLDHIVGDDLAVGTSDRVFIQLTGDNLFNLVLQPQSDLGHFLCGVTRCHFLPCISW